MAAKPKYNWKGDKQGKVHSRPQKGAKTTKPKTTKPKAGGKGKDAPKGGGFEAGLKRRTTKASRDRYVQKAASRRTTADSRSKFLKQHKLRDPDLDDPNYFTRPQTLGQANIEADQATDLRYGGEQQELGFEGEQIARQGRQIQPWFDTYRQTIQGAQAQSQAGAAPAIQGAQQTAAAVSQPVLQAPTGTAPTDPNASAAQNDQLAAASRAALAQSFTTMLQGQQAANSQYFAGRQGVAGAAQIGLQGENNMNARQNQQKKTRLAADRGNFRSGLLADARKNERQYGLERSAFGLNVAKEQNDAAKDAADTKNDAKKLAADAKKTKHDARVDHRKFLQQKKEFGLEYALKKKKERARQRDKNQDQVIAKNKGAGKDGKDGKPTYTPLQRRTARTDLRTAIDLVRTRPGQEGKARRALIDEKHIDPAMASAAVQYVLHGRVNSATQRTLQRDFGIRAPSKPSGPRNQRPGNAPGSRGQQRPT